jgi:cell division protein FtsB
MSILGFLFLVFVFYLAYRLIFDFILPVYRTTRQIKKGFRQMNEQMNQHTQQYNQSNQPNQPFNQSANKGNAGDYIDFEEIKE